jgi:hypothetical protein
VPFEVKALIILAIGKLFEPVLDQLGLEFQNIVDTVKNMNEKYYSQLQIRNSKSIVKQLSMQGGNNHSNSEISVKDAEQYRMIVNQTFQLSESILKNFNAVAQILEKINNIQGIAPEKIGQLKEMADSVSIAARNLSDEKTITGLKYLESIVKK